MVDKGIPEQFKTINCKFCEKSKVDNWLFEQSKVSKSRF